MQLLPLPNLSHYPAIASIQHLHTAASHPIFASPGLQGVQSGLAGKPTVALDPTLAVLHSHA